VSATSWAVTSAASTRGSYAPASARRALIVACTDGRCDIPASKSAASRRGVFTVATALDGEDVVVRVSDTGAGIPDDVRPMIFDPFFTTKDVGRGSGQGLPLARGVVQEGHGGTLTVESVVGEGTTSRCESP
jgi:signal transduction histidine kinase